MSLGAVFFYGLLMLCLGIFIGGFAAEGGGKSEAKTGSKKY